MAAIGTIRKQSGLLIIIVGVALAAFVLGDFLKPSGGGRRSVNIAEVLGEEVNYTYFDTKYEQNLENTKRNQNKENLTADEIFRIKQQTYDQIIQSLVLQNEYEKLGLIVTADELFEQIQGDNPHAYITQYFKDPETQQYDPELVRNYISNLGQMDPATRQAWDDFVNAIDEDRIRTKYKNLITKAFIMPDTFVVSDFNEKKTRAQIRLLGVRYNTINDTAVTVSDEAMKKYYDKYKFNYEQEESRDIEYVVFDVKPSAADRQEIRKDVDEIFEAFKQAENVPLFVNSESDNRYDSTFFKAGELPVQMDSIMLNSEIGTYVDPYILDNAWHMAKLVDIQFRPDSMKASHILISHNRAMSANETITRDRDAAKAYADSLFNVVKSAPANLETLAKQLSDDPSAEQNSGDLGWFADGRMVYPFNNAVITHNVGEITMVETQFGFHIIKVVDKLAPVKKVRVAVIDINISPSQQTYQDVYAQASSFQGQATSLEAFDTLATSMGLTKRSAPNLQKLTNRIAGLDYPRTIIQWAYVEGIDVGSISQVYTMDEKYVVAAVTKINEAGIPEMEDLRETLEPLVRTDLKGEKVVENMKNAYAETQDLSALATKLNAKVDTIGGLTFTSRNIGGFGNETNIIAKVFTMNAGDFAGPVKGNNSAFFVIVDELTGPEAGEDNKVYQKQMLSAFQSKINNNTFLKALEKNADIVDNRIMFY
jgi:peptidyl-prolyl cis-trans isomerase D